MAFIILIFHSLFLLLVGQLPRWSNVPHVQTSFCWVSDVWCSNISNRSCHCFIHIPGSLAFFLSFYCFSELKFPYMLYKINISRFWWTYITASRKWIYIMIIQRKQYLIMRCFLVLADRWQIQLCVLHDSFDMLMYFLYFTFLV